MTVRPDNVPYTAEEQPDGTWVLLELTDADGAIHKEGWAADGTRLYLDELDAETRVRRRIVLFLRGGVAELDFEAGRGDIKRTDLSTTSLGPKLPDFPDEPVIVQCTFEMLEPDAAQMSYEVGATAFRDAERRWVDRDGAPTEPPAWFTDVVVEVPVEPLDEESVVALEVDPIGPTVAGEESSRVSGVPDEAEVATAEMGREEGADSEDELLDTQDAAVDPAELDLDDGEVEDDELLDTQDATVDPKDLGFDDGEERDELLDTQDATVDPEEVAGDDNEGDEDELLDTQESNLTADELGFDDGEAEGEELLDTQDAAVTPEEFDVEVSEDDDELLDTQEASLTPDELELDQDVLEPEATGEAQEVEPAELDLDLEPLDDDSDQVDDLFLPPDEVDDSDAADDFDDFEAAPPSLDELEAAPPSLDELEAAPPSLDKLEAAPPSLDELEAAPPSLDELETAPPSLDELESAPDATADAASHEADAPESEEVEALAWDPTRPFVDSETEDGPRDGRWINTHTNDALHFEAFYEDGALVSLSQKDDERKVQFKRTLKNGEEMLVLYKDRGTLTYVRTPKSRSIQVQFDGMVELTRNVELTNLSSPEDFAEKFELYCGLTESFPFDEVKHPWRIDALGFLPVQAFVDRFERYFRATIFAENEQGDWLVLIEEPGPHEGKIFVNYQLDGLYHLDLLDEYVAEHVDHDVAEDRNRLIEALPFFDYPPIAHDIGSLYRSIDFRLEDESVLADLRPVPELDLTELTS